MRRTTIAAALLLAGCAGTGEPRTPSPPAAAPAAAAPAGEAKAALPQAPIPQEPALTRKEFVARNDEQLLEVFPGLHKSAVTRLMRYSTGKLTNPSRHEVLFDRTGKAYEVFYYLTRDPEGKPVKDRHLTPVIVRDDVVVAIGAYRLKKLKRGESLDLPRGRARRPS